MTIYTLETETGNITAFPTAEAAAAVSQTPFDVFTNQQELAELIAQWRPIACCPPITVCRACRPSNACTIPNGPPARSGNASPNWA